MIRRSKTSENRETEFLKSIFEKYGAEGVRKNAEDQAEKFWNGSHIVYKSKEDMADGFFKDAMKKIDS